MLETFLTVILPGLGHLYYGYTKKAFCLIGLSILAAYFIPLYLLLYPYALYDIWKISKTEQKPTFEKSDAVKVIVIGLLVPAILILAWSISIPYFIKFYQNNVSFPNKVLIDGREISTALENYYQSYGYYPEKLAIIIEGRPLRKRWENDLWGRPYYYKTNEMRNSYILLSCGPDGLKGTADDYLIKNIGK